MNPTTTIPKKVTQGADLVVLTKQAYDQLQRQLFELEDALQKIQSGEEARVQGRLKTVKSLRELEE